MPISDGITNLKKIAFQIGDELFKFAINPENMINHRPHRATAVKTKSRIVIEDFQSDIATITISGTTGFNPTGIRDDRGIIKIKKMKQALSDYAELGGNGDTPPVDFIFYDFTNDESWIVHLSAEGVTYTQSIESPLTHRYDIKFTVLRQAAEPSDDEVVSPEIGNRFPSLPRGSGFSDPEYGNVYNQGATGGVTVPQTEESVNPQAPSPLSYAYGVIGLGYSIGYYLRKVLP
jgi:hypothetical protein